MKYYAKITEKNKKEMAIQLLTRRGALTEEIIFDATSAQKQPESIYIRLKEEIIQSGEALTVDTMNSLGKNSREIFKEINQFWNRGIRVYIADLDFTYDTSVDPMLALDKIFEKLAEVEKCNVKVAQKTGIERYINENGTSNYGRQKLPYPENWEQNYALWRSGEITATEFMNRSGLKKGTFYNMVKDYKSNGILTKNKRA